MMRLVKITLVVIGFFLMIGTIAFGNFFLTTGGGGLGRIVWYYLIPNIPNRQYGWQDFVDRGPEQNISGFYSSSNENGLSMWTLSGLKTFKIDPGVSKYRFTDFCETISKVDLADETAYHQSVLEATINDFDQWRGKMKKEYFLTIQRQNNDKNLIYLLWSRSGKYKNIEEINLETCK